MINDADAHARAVEKLIVALDFPSVNAAQNMAALLPEELRFLKIGLELIYAGGLPLAKSLAEKGRQIFLDAKLSDIPNTVERATASAAQLGARFITVHGAERKTLNAAVCGRGDSKTQLLAITVLTSIAANDLREQGISMSLTELVLTRARMAKEAGFDGVVASAQEAKSIRAELGPDFLIVTPGIRPYGVGAGDQARTVTPADAIAAGADYLVVGRPITFAPNPCEAARAIITEIKNAL